tara:strand:+ start:374 stop:676 length:303 start_codon:yes stop_codon:yes gene_type:complete
VDGFSRHKPVEVSQQWLDAHRAEMDLENWNITGDYAGVEFHEGIIGDDGDGVPDMNWLKADIQQWLFEQGVEMSGLRATKAKMIDKVQEVLGAEVAQEED